MNAEMPMVPKISFSVVDVRDVARAHILALQKPAEVVNGKRFILSGDSYWFKDMAGMLSNTFESQGYKIPKREVSSAQTHIHY